MKTIVRNCVIFFAALFALSAAMPAKVRTLAGTVFDRDTHQVIAGAKIRANLAERFTITDQNGHYHIDIPDGCKTLIVSDTSKLNLFAVNCFRTDTIRIGKSNRLDVYLTRSIKIKEDTTEYQMAAYRRNVKEQFIDILKNIPNIDVDQYGVLIYQGRQIFKAQIDGREFYSGNVSQILNKIKNTIVDKIQIIDDYGDSAAITSIKSGDPKEVLNIITHKKARKIIHYLK